MAKKKEEKKKRMKWQNPTLLSLGSAATFGSGNCFPGSGANGHCDGGLTANANDGG